MTPATHSKKEGEEGYALWCRFWSGHARLCGCFTAVHAMLGIPRLKTRLGLNNQSHSRNSPLAGGEIYWDVRHLRSIQVSSRKVCGSRPPTRPRPRCTPRICLTVHFQFSIFLTEAGPKIKQLGCLILRHCSEGKGGLST